MVGGKAVDDVHVVPERLHVLAGAQLRPHGRTALPEAPQVVLAQEEVMRGHLARHRDPPLLGRLDQEDLGEPWLVGNPQWGPVLRPRTHSSPRSPPPCGPRGRCGQDAGTAGPPSARRPPSAAQRGPRWASDVATAPDAGGERGWWAALPGADLPRASPCPPLLLTSIHRDTLSIRRLEKVSFRYILRPAAAPARGPRVPALSGEAPRKRAKSQRAPASASCRITGSGCCGGTSPATSNEPTTAGTGGDEHGAGSSSSPSVPRRKKRRR